MKPLLEPIGTPGVRSFLVRRFEETKFRAPYHFHPQLELTFIVRGSGKRFVGTSMADFHAGDFVLLGPNLPHCWKTESSQPKEKSCSIVVQFDKDFLGADFFCKPEMRRLQLLLQKAGAGLLFTGDQALYQTKMEALTGEPNSFRQLLALLDLLHQLSLTKKYRVLNGDQTPALPDVAEQERLHAVMGYIIEHFREPVSLAAAARLAHMTPQSFCKYFKRHTRKTFVQAVMDYRIDYAAQQLVKTDHSISQISFDSGFNDLSHFHKTFRTRLHLSPLSYRNSFLARL